MNRHTTPGPTSSPIVRSAPPSSSTTIESDDGYNFSVHRPVFLPSSMSSLQVAAAAAAGNVTGRTSPLRYPRESFTTRTYSPFTVYQTPSKLPPPPGLYHQKSDSSDANATIERKGTTHHASSPPSAFSSLRHASIAAGLQLNHPQYHPPQQYSSLMALPIHRIPEMQKLHDQDHDDSNMETSQMLQNGRHRHDAEYNDDEPEMHWNPPIREAIFSASSPLPNFSPLTLSNYRSTPPTTFHDHPVDSLSQSRGKSASRYAFVPIQEWDDEVNETVPYKEDASFCSSSPTKLSSTSKSWEPMNRNNEIDYPDIFPSHQRQEAYKPHFASNLQTPTKMPSCDYGNKGVYGNSNKLAPSPTLTVETADMTVDTPSTAESASVDHRRIKSSSLLLAMNAPTVYMSPTQPPSHSLRRIVSFHADPDQKNFQHTSLSLEIAGQHRDYHDRVTPSSVQEYGSTAMGQSQYNYCRYVNEQEQVHQSRSQSAPTLGRPSFLVPTKSDEDMQQRKCRVKTELCMHYENGRPCPFGSNCTYAHGEEELQMTKLIDLHDAGLVDMNTYRTKPCLTWVATGSCPFGKRCAGIHDYRVGSSFGQSWLPHTETQGNTIETDINVDGLHQKRLHAILYDNPFGDNFTLTSTSPSGQNTTTGIGTWDDLSRLVCGGSNGSEGGLSTGKNHRDGWIVGCNKRGGRQIHPIYKLQIALKLRGTDPDWQYKYRPQHVVHDELCMILQKRAYRVTGNDHVDGSSKNHSSKTSLTACKATAISSVLEIPLSTYNSRSPNQILVHEIAFGPDSDPTVRGVALWFNLSSADITECTPQQAKRFRWKKNVANPSVSSTASDKKGSSATKASHFDSGAIENFVMVRPHDGASFRLATDIMKLRLSVLKREQMNTMKERFEAQQKIKKQEERLQERFDNLRRFWIHWAWPVSCGREYVDDTTPVPPVEGPYVLKMSDGTDKKKVQSGNEQKDPQLDADSTELGKNVHSLWNSFVTNIAEEKENDDTINSTNSQHSKRLPVFESLCQGKPLSDDRRLPHISKHRFIQQDHPNVSNKGTVGVVSSYRIQQERCWKSLLLHANSSYEANEWEIVREHFENSRSKKVLSIIQQ